MPNTLEAFASHNPGRPNLDATRNCVADCEMADVKVQRRNREGVSN
jgi:hypothetical protein